MHRYIELYLSEAYSLPNRVVRFDGMCGGIELSNGRDCCLEFGEDLVWGGDCVTEFNICGCVCDANTWSTLETVYVPTPRRSAGIRLHTLLGQIKQTIAGEDAYA